MPPRDPPDPDGETIFGPEEAAEASESAESETIRPGSGETLPLAAAGRTARPENLAGESGASAGHYRLVRPLGQGGAGVVYLAEQTEPVKRHVALKVIRSGLDSAEIVARFEAERQALALMDHPNIATVFDAGLMEEGRPYIAMEYVPGTPITEFCDEHRLTVRERLELFVHVCDAVQHAHQKGIIHRDLKPSNVLVVVVDGEPVPKVIDFGVAKATESSLMETSAYTEQGQLLGTPEYMSPEQAEMTGLNIDTRTDIYSLGTLLYEMLAGALPFDSHALRSAGYAGIQKFLREKEPVKPSERLATNEDGKKEVAERRRLAAPKLQGAIRGDLDWITMKAMEKDRTHRYASASEFALDVRRHLHDEPVLAGPPSVRYRLGKLRRRHRAFFAGAAAVVVALLAGVAGTTWQAIRATQAERKAVEKASVATAVSGFLTDMLAEANPERNQDREITLREVLDDAASRVEDGFEDQPTVRASVRNAIGNTYLGLGRYDQAEPHLRAALETRMAIPGIEEAEIAESQRNLGRLHWSRSDYAAAEPLIRDALRSYRELFGEADDRVVACLIDLAVVRQTLGDYEAAEAMLRAALESKRSLGLADDEVVAEILSNLAWIRRFRGDLVESETLSRQALDLNRTILGEDHPTVLILGLNLAAMVQERGGYEEAEVLYRQVLERMRTILGPDHPVTLQGQMSLGEMYIRQGDVGAGEPLLRETLAAAERTLGPDHQVSITLVADVGWALRARGDLEASEGFYREALLRRSRSLGDDNPLTIRSRWQVSRVLVDRREFVEGERFAREALEVGRRVLPPENENLTSTLAYLGLALVGQGEFAAAEPYLRECHGALTETMPEGRWEREQVRSALGSALAGQGRFAEAEPWLIESARALQADADAPRVRVRKALERVVDLYRSWSAAAPEAGKAAALDEWRAELDRLGGAPD